MLKKENIICISSIDWSFVWQGHQEIMATFARSGNRVLFIENTGVRPPRIGDFLRIKDRLKNWLKGVKGVRKEMENLYVYSPIALPYPYSRIARWINCRLILPVLRKWMKIMDFNSPVVWTFLPTGLVLDLLNNIDSKLIVYYCIADFEKLVPHPHKVRKTEKAVIKKSDLIFVQGEKLKEHCQKHNNNIFIFPFGVNIDAFKQVDCNKRKPLDISHIKGPMLGYIGGVHRHVDFGLMRFIAERNPQWTFVIIGPLQREISEISDLKNIVFLDLKAHKELAGYIGAFDVCLIPYLLNEYTETVYPTKLNEYFAIGKPVVSTALPEVIDFNRRYKNIVYIGKDKKEFEYLIRKALGEKDKSVIERRIEIAKENNWSRRIENMSSVIENEIEKKKTEAETKWKENLIRFYRITRRRTIGLIAAGILLYLILFKTDFIWFVAAPLRISEPPQKADAIVVFGGGVGEAGSPGNSTIERARYASELYLKGYADKVIFSSGYTYVYNDAENMKLVAVSMGVLSKDIILEQNANSTYENALFSKGILDQYRYDSILLVSSPYNMRRASLVFNKWDKDLKILYTPVADSQFYDRQYGVRLEQIRAIIHEYAGIVYYFFKGYI